MKLSHLGSWNSYIYGEILSDNAENLSSLSSNVLCSCNSKIIQNETNAEDKWSFCIFLEVILMSHAMVGLWKFGH
jgi:hypothetical protein